MRPPRLLPGLMTALLLATTQAKAAETPLSPVQAAFFKSEVRKADDQFVARVAKLAGSPESQVRKAMPGEGRIADPASRVIAALEAERKSPLDEALRNQIAAAEQQRRTAIAAAREAALKR